MTQPLEDVVEEARRLAEAARAQGLPLKVTGGVGIRLRAPAAARPPFARAYRDLDFVSLSARRREVERFFEAMGYTGHKAFNTLHGHERLYFVDPVHGRHVDVFLDRLRMCHTFDLRDRVDGAGLTLPPADLLLGKLQIVEINAKDLLDALALLCEVPVGRGDEDAIDADYIARLAAADWGVYRTLQLNVGRLRDTLDQVELDAHLRDTVRQRLDALWSAVEAHPKPLAWRLRAAVGDRVRWYELPEEPRPDDVG